MRRPTTVHRAEPEQEPPKIPPIAIVMAVAAALIVVVTLLASRGGGDDKKDGGLLGNAPTPASGVTSVPAATPTAIIAGGTTPTPAAGAATPTTGGTTPTPVTAVERILFNSDRDGKEDIYTMNSDGSAQTRLTSGAGTARLPNALLDGSRIVFVSDRDRPGFSSEVYVMNGDG